MKKLARIARLTAIALVASAAAAFASGSVGGLTADEALAELLHGNQQFVLGDHEHMLHNISELRRLDTGLNGQKPYAIVVTCADSRLSPEILFNKGIGEVFVIRVAGNVVAPHELGSIEYGAEHLGAKLILVLGHSKCGAVSAAYDYFSTPEELRPELSKNLESIVDSIEPAVDAALEHHGDKAMAEDLNIAEVVRQIRKKSRVIRDMEEEGVEVMGAKYDIVTGEVTLQGIGH